MQPRSRKHIKQLLGGLIAFAAILGLLAAAFGAIVNRVPEYRVQVQDWLHARSGLIIEFSALRARMRLHGPELVFDDAVVRTPDRSSVLATAERGSVGFDVWSAIRTGRLNVGRFALRSPQIGLIRTRDGRIQLLGQSALPERTNAAFGMDQLPIGRFSVERAVVTFRDEITGRGPWSVSGVSFELTREVDRLQLTGAASLPSGLGRELTFAADARGPLEAYQSLASRFSVRGEQIDLAGWADVFPDEWPAPETGRGDIYVQGELLGPTLMRIHSTVDLRDVAAAAPAWSIALPTAAPMIPPAPDRPPSEEIERDPPHDPQTLEAESPDAPRLPELVSYTRLSLTASAQRDQGAWDVRISDLELMREDVPWRAADVRARWSSGADGALQVEGRADAVVLDSLWPLLAFLPESDGLAKLRALQARGRIEDLSVRFRRERAQAPPAYSLSANVAGLSFAPVGKAPGFSGLSGAVQGTQDGGSWRLAPDTVRFDLPRWFRTPLSAHVDEALIEWRREEEAWLVESSELRFNNDDGRASARFSARRPDDGSSPVLDITAQGEGINVRAASKYIPAGRLGVRTMEWFDQAFLGGKVLAAEFTLRGPSRSFPFRDGEGEFIARATVEDAEFSYQPGWTPALDLDAKVEFHNAGLRIVASNGDIGGLKLSAAQADIPDLKRSELTISGKAQGDLHAALEYLKASPLGPTLGEQFARLDGQGPLEAQVKLFLPIRQLANRDVEVGARLTNATATYADLSAPVRNVSGSLTVRNTLLAKADLRGRWLGGPVHATITPLGRSASQLAVEARTQASLLTAALSAPPAVKLDGAFDWRASMRLDAAGAQRSERTVHLQSDTRGLHVGLPAPLGKPADEAREFEAALALTRAGEARLRTTFGDVRALVNLRRDGEGWSLERGGVRADGAAPSLPDHTGLRLEGSVDRLRLDDWFALQGSGGGGRSGKPVSAWLRAANLRVGELELFGYRWPDVRGVLQAQESGWRVDVDGPSAQGQMLIPTPLTGAAPLRLALERLVLERTERRARPTQSAPIDPRQLPGLQAHVGELRLGSKLIGTVDVNAARTARGLRLDLAQIRTPSLNAEGRGYWYVTADGPRSALNATISSSDVAATLAALNYTNFLEAEGGELRADLTWPGGYDGNILEQASGEISVRVDSGQIVNLEPGAGRMLGLFSIAALPRRLALDFSDLTDKGLAFDAIEGDFELRNGQAYTSNLLLRGPAAEIGIAGRTGFGSRDYDQTAVVTGKLGASLPIAGALAGGPAVGAAVLLFSQVFKEPLKGMTRGYYRITGPWDDPRVERIDAAEATSGAGARVQPEDQVERVRNDE